MQHIPDSPPFRVCCWPLHTIGLAIFCIAAHAYVPLSDCLAYDRTAIQAGEVWRLLTGHLAHYRADHLLWDVLMFVVLGVMVERRNRGSFIVTVLASATAITAVLWFAYPEVTAYRGLSGIDSALFTSAAILLYVYGRRFNRPLVRLISAGLLAGFVAKVIYEIASGNTLFVDSTDFVSLAAVHAAGGFVGVISAVPYRRGDSATLSQNIPQGGALGMGL
jgi:rhomboid family GlyGly-CTERM serine protease